LPFRKEPRLQVIALDDVSWPVLMLKCYSTVSTSIRTCDLLREGRVPITKPYLVSGKTTFAMLLTKRQNQKTVNNKVKWALNVLGLIQSSLYLS